MLHNHRHPQILCGGMNGRQLAGRLESWRMPDELKDSDPQVITLENSGSSSPGRLRQTTEGLPLQQSRFSASASFAIQGSTVIFSGMLSPNLENQTITIYVRTNGMSWSTLGKVVTDSNGSFSLAWIAYARFYHERKSFYPNALVRYSSED